MDSRKSNHRSKDMELSRENLQRTRKTRVMARKRTMSLEGQESRTRKDQDQGQERTRQSQDQERNSVKDKKRPRESRPNYDFFIGANNKTN